MIHGQVLDRIRYRNTSTNCPQSNHPKNRLGLLGQITTVPNSGREYEYTVGKIEFFIRPVSRWQWFAAVLKWVLFFFSPPRTQKRLSLFDSRLKKKNVVKSIDGEPRCIGNLLKLNKHTDNLDISNEVNKKTLFPSRFPSRMD